MDPPDLSQFDYSLPPERIAQEPCARREDARLMQVRRHGEPVVAGHGHVRDLPRLLRPHDLLVLNATQVLPARLVGHRKTGGAVEALLLGPEKPGSGLDDPGPGRDKAETPPGKTDALRYRALLRISGRLRPSIEVVFERGDSRIEARVVEVRERGEVVLAFDAGPDQSVYDLGSAPLPPYIQRFGADSETDTSDLDRYQTVYARVPGSIAAPTAGLHLTDGLLTSLRERRVEIAEVVLHVGAGTFRPVGEEELRSGRLHVEAFELTTEAAEAIARTRARGGRVIAVGTTSARVLEACARDDGTVSPQLGETDLFLYPGRPLRVIDGLLTNFHLPRSSLLLLVAAFAGRERVLSAYREAIAADYRFYSYGDAMLIL